MYELLKIYIPFRMTKNYYKMSNVEWATLRRGQEAERNSIPENREARNARQRVMHI